MSNFDDAINEETKEYNPYRRQISDHIISYRILTTRGSGSRETNSLFDLISQ